jgi:hypothetical protein
MIFALFLLFSLPGQPQTVPTGWKVMKDAKASCQIAVPPEWAPLGETSGAAVLQDSTTAIAVVTSQPGQEFKPLSPGMLKTFGVPKGKMFENSVKRIFFQDKTSARADDPNAFSSSVAAKSGTCSCHVVVLPSVPEEVAKKIALSLDAVPDKH